MNPEFEFTEHAARNGYALSEVVADGKLRRFPHNDSNGGKAGWQILSNVGEYCIGIVGDWRTGNQIKWSSHDPSKLTSKQRKDFTDRQKALSRKVERERKQRQAEARKKAAEIWKTAKPAPADHPYLIKKQIQPHGLRVTHDGKLIVPVRQSDGTLTSLQFIEPDGEKRFLTGGEIKGSCFSIKGDDRIFLAEGYATSATIHETAGGTVVVVFNAGNLKPVAHAVREKHPQAEIVICADNDAFTDGNPGITKGREAAQAVKAKVVWPMFKDTQGKPTDFNDLATLQGLAEVKRQLGLAGKKGPHKVLRARHYSDLQKQFSAKIDWIYKRHIPRAEPVLIDGREGSGKTTIVLCIVDEILETNPDGVVVWIATEGAVRDTVVKMGEIDRHLVGDRFMIAQKPNGDFIYNLAEKKDQEALAEFLKYLDAPILAVCIDSIRGMTPLRDRDDRIGKVMHQLNSIVCEKHNGTLIYLHHQNKQDGELRDKSTGTTAIPAAVRHRLSIVLMGKTKRVLKCSKSNIDDTTPDLQVMKIGRRLSIFEGESLDEGSLTDQAEIWLSELFDRESEILSTHIYNQGKEQGFSEHVLKKAKKRLGLKSKRDSTNGIWYWTLPIQRLPCPPWHPSIDNLPKELEIQGCQSRVFQECQGQGSQECQECQGSLECQESLVYNSIPKEMVI